MLLPSSTGLKPIIRSAYIYCVGMQICLWSATLLQSLLAYLDVSVQPNHPYAWIDLLARDCTFGKSKRLLIFCMVIRVSFINKDQVIRDVQTDLTELKR